MIVRWLGRLHFEEALAIQEQIVARKIAAPGSDDELLLLEHDPVYTIGRTPDQSSLRGSAETRLAANAQLPHPVVQINRGGQATYHGPGQLIVYPILELRSRGQDLHRYLRALEEVLIEFCRSYDVAAQRRDGLTGVWVEHRKIASIGVGVRRWISMHGFALNVCGDLAPFAQITPCGIAGVEMTSLAKETLADLNVQSVATEMQRLFPSRLPELLPRI